MQFRELKLPTKIISYIFISIICLTILYPVIWMSYTALKPNTEVMRSPFGLPTKIDFSNINEAWTTGNFTRLYFNTLLVSVLSVLGIVGFSSAAAYALARYDFRFKRFFFIYFLIGIGVPTQSLIIPGFKVNGNSGCLGTNGAFAIYFSQQPRWSDSHLLELGIDRNCLYSSLLREYSKRNGRSCAS